MPFIRKISWPRGVPSIERAMMELMRESNPEYDAFTRTMDKLLTDSHDEMKRRMEAYKKLSAKNPRKRGPKPKSTRHP